MKTINRKGAETQRGKKKPEAGRLRPEVGNRNSGRGARYPVSGFKFHVSSFLFDSVTLGEFRIAMHDGKPWIFHKDGENMQTSVEALESALSKFWEEEF
jgi:hypothetical protein